MVAMQCHSAELTVVQLNKRETELNSLYRKLTRAMKSDRLLKQRVLSYDITKVTYDISRLRNQELNQSPN